MILTRRALFVYLLIAFAIGMVLVGFSNIPSGYPDLRSIHVPALQTPQRGSPTPASTFTLTVNIVGSGTAVKNPDLASYTSGSIVQLTASPGSGYQFSGWSGGASGSTNPTNITVNSNLVVTATFVPVSAVSYTLTVNVNPSGGGTVTKNPNLSQYSPGTVVTLTANAAIGYQFSNWSGAASGTSNPITVTMNSDLSVTANFVTISPVTYTLTVNVSPSGGGTVTKNPNLSQYSPGTVVTLTANAATGFQFSNWSGEASGTSNPITVTMNSNLIVTAGFAVIASSSTAATTTPTSNSVSSASATITPLLSGTSATVTPTPTQALPTTGFSLSWLAAGIGLVIVLAAARYLRQSSH